MINLTEIIISAVFIVQSDVLHRQSTFQYLLFAHNLVVFAIS